MQTRTNQWTSDMIKFGIFSSVCADTGTARKPQVTALLSLFISLPFCPPSCFPLRVLCASNLAFTCSLTAHWTREGVQSQIKWWEVINQKSFWQGPFSWRRNRKLSSLPVNESQGRRRRASSPEAGGPGGRGGTWIQPLLRSPLCMGPKTQMSLTHAGNYMHLKNPPS